MLLEPPDHADVRDPARAAAAERDANRRPTGVSRHARRRSGAGARLRHGRALER